MNRSAHHLPAILLGAVMAWALVLPGSASGSASASHLQQTLDARATDPGMKRDKDADAREDKWAANTTDQQWQHDPVRFTARDREAIRIHYRGISNIVPAKNNGPRDGNLSPGVRRRLQRNGMLPADLQKRLEPLADDVERHLRVLPRGYSRGVIGHDVLDVLIVENRTQRIMDIIRDVAGRR